MTAKHDPSQSAQTSPPTVRQRVLFMFRLVGQPLLFFVAGIALLALLGVAQRVGWITANAGTAAPQTLATTAAPVDYICPMMCTPPQKEPGRCPVCAMELVPASASSAGHDGRTVAVDPVTRRVANIRTAQVARRPMSRTIRTVGEITYDEGNMKTIAAYSEGRFDRMYVDYTGAKVEAGDPLASFYSPDLYSAQAALLQAIDAAAESGLRPAVAQVKQQLKHNARQRLVELGMSEQQILRLVQDRKARSRVDIVAPMHGTVIERLVVEGDYVKAGQPVFRLADLSTVWLMLELFPEDAAVVRYGQQVEARLRSLPEQVFYGRIAFVDPEVSKQTRTVSVRVVLENPAGRIRIGDYAKASIEVPIGLPSHKLVYDPELANKWISPRHPHVVGDEPGLCPQCGVKMVPAAELGFTDQPQPDSAVLVVPRSAILSAANQSVVYVEVERGRFELRRVVAGPVSGDQVVIVEGLSEGESVAIAGAFLLDSQMQLAGNPSLIDPARVESASELEVGFSPGEVAQIQQLPAEERQLAIQQTICPVSDMNLGSMGVPFKVVVDRQTVFVCCEGCRGDLLAKPSTHLAKLQKHKSNTVQPTRGSGATVPTEPRVH